MAMCSASSPNQWLICEAPPMATSCGMVITTCPTSACSIQPGQSAPVGLQQVQGQQLPFSVLPALQGPEQQQQQQQQHQQQQAHLMMQGQKFLLQNQQQQQQQPISLPQPAPSTEPCGVMLLGNFQCNLGKPNLGVPMSVPFSTMGDCSAQFPSLNQKICNLDGKQSNNNNNNFNSKQSNSNTPVITSAGSSSSGGSTLCNASKLSSFTGSDGSSSSTPPDSGCDSGRLASRNIANERGSKGGKAKAGGGKSQHSPLGMPTQSQQRVSNTIDVEDAFATELWKKLATGGQAVEQVVGTMSSPGLLRRLTFEPVGCRTVQATLDAVPPTVAAQLSLGLKGSVLDAIYSRHGNYVVQKIIKVLTPAQSGFIPEEIAKAGPVATVACHEYGCRIFCRLLEFTATNPFTIHLIDSCLEALETMVCHTYGHHVIESVLDYGLQRQQAFLLQFLKENHVRITSNRSGAFVAQKALSVANNFDRAQMVERWLDSTPEDVAAMVSTPAGQGVFKLLLAHDARAEAQVLGFFQHEIVQQSLLQTKHGRGLLEAHGFALPAAAATIKN